MNKISLQAQEVLETYFDCNNASEVFNKIKKDLEGQNKFVCSLRINNQIIPEDKEAGLVHYNLSNLHLVEVEYCEYDEFYTEFVSSTIAFIKDLKLLSPHISEAIYEQNQDAFNELFHDFINSMDSLLTALQYIQTTRQPGDLAWGRVEAKMSSILKQLLDLYPAKDFVSMADIFDYEILDVLEEWQSLLQTNSADEKRRES